MFIRMTKVLLALGLMTAAGSSGAFYIPVGGGGQQSQNGYSGQVWFTDNTGRGVMDITMLGCEGQLDREILAATKPIKAVEECHWNKRWFGTVPVTDSYVLTPGVITRFLEGTRALREQFRIEDYERAQDEFERSFSRELKP